MYHSQRSGRQALESRPGEWPAAGFFEYESVQAVMRLGGGGGGGGVSEHYSNRSLPRHHERMRSAPHPAYSGPGQRRQMAAEGWDVALELMNSFYAYHRGLDFCCD